MKLSTVSQGQRYGSIKLISSHFTVDSGSIVDQIRYALHADHGS